MTDDERAAILKRYLEGDITAGQAADGLGPRVSVSEVILETRDRFGALPDRDDDFTRSEYRRALALLGLPDRPTRPRT